ncbi:hypothetical protein DFP72DRAFT_898082 [Ephemerocybe angulata]|uniref:F-box domain-containing protein n=1 Tax=Ephemerocybe angulata TaxID=980116 RepID=A0A8H6I038_9AGAR|nr:hypothetical protein DFP72DRAFT_898082 [Tulosesus angulatus]
MTLPFPPELLLAIFNVAVHTSYDSADQLDPPSLDMLMAMEEDPTPSTPAPSGPTGIHKDVEYPESQLQPGIIAHVTNPFTPLHLSHVCKDWRDAAFSAPELWSSIYVADGRPNTYRLLRLWLQNSGSQPLDIVFRETLNGSSGDTIVELIQMAAEHSVRWRTFKVRLRRQKLSIKEVAKVLHGIVTPLLQTLAFSFNTIELGDTQFDDLWMSLITNAPKLQELQMWSATYSKNFLAAIPFDRLTCIALIMVRFQGEDLFWKALRGCKVLRTLSISFGLGPATESRWYTTQPSSPAVVSIPSLRHFNLVGGSDLCLLLLGLHLPSLNSLTMHTNHVERYVRRPITDVYIALEDFLTRSRCQLLSFKIRDEREGAKFERRVSPILRHSALRDLVELTLGSPVGKKTLEYLVGSPTNDGLLQGLKRIDLQALALGEEIPVASVTEMAASRSCDSRLAVNLVFLTVGFLSRTQLILEMRAWNDYIAEEGNLTRNVEKVFYYASGAERTRRLKGEFLCRDFSMIQGW